jgi:hypothetical protein
MTGAGDSRPRGLAACAAAALLLAVAALGSAPVPPVVAAEDELFIETSSSYTLDPAAAAVHVVVDVTATNRKPNLVQQTPTGTRTTRYFYDGVLLVIHSEAVSVKARAGKSALTVRVSQKEGYAVAEVRFRQDLFFGQSTKFTLTYDLPGGAPRSDSDIRVGSAFATFYAWAFGNRGSVLIRVPAGFDVETTGSPLVESVADGVRTLTATAISGVPDWYAIVVADRHDALTTDRLDLPGGEHLVIRAWPEDAEWLSRVSDLLRVGLPALVDEIGLDWPVEGDIEVAEVHTPLLEGYSGVFYTNRDLIEISEDLDELTIIHEASHAWFNADLFVGRWIDEGLADEYASRVLDAVSVGGLEPEPLTPDSDGAVRLNEWTHPGRIADAETDARETFGYEASWTVVRDLVHDIGEDRMRAVFSAADARQVAYVGAGEPETVTIPNDWRRFLDLLEEAGGSTDADRLFRRWVVTPDQLPQLDARASAREAYKALVEAGDGWMPGFAVRDPLGRWQFAEATKEIAAADGVLDVRDEIGGIASELEVAPPASLRAAYEGAQESLDDARALADEQLAAARSVLDAAHDVAAERDVFTSLGLIGEDPAAALAVAEAAFSSGDTDAASDDATAIRALIDGADDAGRTRALAGGGVAVAAGGVVVALAMRRRRRAGVELPAADAVGAEAGAEPVPGTDATAGQAEAAAEPVPGADANAGAAEAAPLPASALAPSAVPGADATAGQPAPVAPSDAGAAPFDETEPYATLGGQPPVAPADGPAAPMPVEAQPPAAPDPPAPPEGDEGDRT